MKKGIEFLIVKESDVPDTLIGDSLRLNQVLLNLTNNAVKFTDEGEVSIRVSKVEENDSQIILRFSVKDTGIGMSNDQKNALFQAFSQADMSITRKYGGTGLGLAITKNLVEMMKGKINVISEQGSGSEFFFEIPFKYNSSVIRKSRIVPDYINDLKIAVLEDNETALEMYKHYLSHLKYETDFFTSSEDLMAEYEPGRYNLVILDYKLKTGDGVEAWNEIKEKSEESLPSSILVTAYGKEHVIDEAKENGISTVLMKPITQSSLFNGLLTAIKGEHIVELNSDFETFIQEMKPYAGNRILLVEDNPINQQVALENLEMIGFAIDVADNGLEAVEMVDHSLELYDLILMDLQMPIMDGFTATEEIRKRLDSNKLPIIALSADVMKETIERIERIGIQDHVAKPINLKDLYTAMKKWLKPKASTKKTVAKELQAQASEIDFERMMPEFNVKDALGRLAGNGRLYKKLLAGFVETYNIDLNDETKNMEETEAVRFYHTLKGLSGNIGANKTQEAAKTIELGLKDHVFSVGTLFESEAFKTLKDQLKHDVKTVENCLSSVLETIEEEEGILLSDAQYVEKLTALLALLDEYDMDSESALNEIASEVSRREGESIKAKLKKAVEAYEYEEALDYVRTMLAEYEGEGN